MAYVAIQILKEEVEKEVYNRKEDIEKINRKRKRAALLLFILGIALIILSFSFGVIFYVILAIIAGILGLILRADVTPSIVENSMRELINDPNKTIKEAVKNEVDAYKEKLI